jgi:sterol 24-C-methyltransferase
MTFFFYDLLQAKCFAEVMRVLKPNGSFSGYDWCLTDKFDSQNKKHVEIKHLVEEGDGLPELKSGQQLLSDINSAGLNIEDSFIVPAGDIPWYFPLKGGDSFLSLNNFRATIIGRWVTRNVVWLLEKTWIAAQGSAETLVILEKAATSLVDAGESDILTPYFFFLARKPNNK